jgi:argininosuccinate synthase
MSISEEIIALRKRLEALSEKEADAPTDELEKALLPVFKEYRHLQDKNVAVLFSGGLDTSYIVHFLANVIGAKVTTIAANVGSTEPREISWDEQQQEIRKRALELGAIRHETPDCRKPLANLAMVAVKAEAALGGGFGHPPASSLSRTVISEAVIDYAVTHECNAIFHGSNGSQNNPYRFHYGLRHYAEKKGFALLPPGEKAWRKNQLVEATPNLDCPLTRDQEELYLKKFGVPIFKDPTAGNISTDENLCGNEREEAGISNPEQRYKVFKGEAKAEEDISVRFKHGVPVALKCGEEEWKNLPPLQMMEELNRIGYAHHIGEYDYAEARPNGLKVREIHVSPALTILNSAHSRLRSHIVAPEKDYIMRLLSQDWSTLVMECNLWTDPLREKLDKAFTQLNEPLTGEVSVALSQGRISAPSIKANGIRKEGTTPPVNSLEVGLHATAGPLTHDGRELTREQLLEPTDRDPMLKLHHACGDLIMRTSRAIATSGSSHCYPDKGIIRHAGTSRGTATVLR